jgi:hypothetical protein
MVPTTVASGGEMAQFDTDSPRRMSLPRIAVWVFVVLVVSVAANWYQQNREMDHLLGATESSEAAEKASIAEEKRIVTTAPVYAGTTTLRDPNAVRADIQAAAGDAAAHVLTTGDDVRDVSIWPWHRALKRARERYLANSQAWQRHLSVAAHNATELNNPVPEIEGTWLSAGKAYRDALPPFPMYHARSRVDHIFDD